MICNALNILVVNIFLGFFSEDGMPLRHLEKTTCGICGELNVGCNENNEPEKTVFIQSKNKLKLTITFSIYFRVVICSTSSVFVVGLLLGRSKRAPCAKKKSI